MIYYVPVEDGPTTSIPLPEGCTAYKISGALVAYCISRNTVLEDLPLETYQTYSDLFDEDLYEAIDLMNCVQKRISEGGTSVASVEAQIQYVKEMIMEESLC